MQFIDDVRYAMRQFAQAPGFTATALLTLALGIGATTAIFTLVHAVLLKSLPVAKPSELIRIGDNENCCVNGGLRTAGRFSPTTSTRPSAMERVASPNWLPSRPGAA